jgi:Ni,Fe-hydrogenase I large subunit
MGTFSIDPVNRIEGHQKWTIDHDASGSGRIVTKAYVKGMMFRGFERILEQRDPRDAIIICGRI